MTPDRFPPLEGIAGVCAAFLPRVPGIAVDAEREVVLGRLASAHRIMADAAGFSGMPFASAEQVHGADLAVVNAPMPAVSPGVDGLLTSRPGIALAIYVADCAAVFLADRHARAIALVHSGKKGTQLGIATRAVQELHQEFGVAPGDLVAVVSPCIRPPHYEVDFAADIRNQLREAGVTAVFDEGVCTAENPRYYSYRREKGRTGRMLALLALTR